MKQLIMGLMALVSTCAAAPITYTGQSTLGVGTATLTITTDGTIGVLSTANILDWTIAMVDAGDSFTLLGPLSGNNSQVAIVGTALSATLTDLIFDFDAGGVQYALFQAPVVNTDFTYYCVETNGCAAFNGPQEVMNPRLDTNYIAVPRSGSVVLASTRIGEVPEPSTWATLATGLGAIAVMRRKRSRQS